LGKLSIVAEFGEYLLARKKWWLVPLMFLLLLLAGLIVVSQTPAVAPFLYALW